MESNKKPGTEAEGRLQTVISELDITIDDLLGKASFAIMQIQELAAGQGISVADNPLGFAYQQPRMEMFSHIAYDYVARAQSALTSLILRERRKGGKEPEPTAEDAQKIIKRINQIRDPAILLKISDFVESWTEDEGGQVDG